MSDVTVHVDPSGGMDTFSQSPIKSERELELQPLGQSNLPHGSSVSSDETDLAIEIQSVEISKETTHTSGGSPATPMVTSPTPGPLPRRDSLFGTAEDASLEEFLRVRRMTGYSFSILKELGWWLLCACTGFILWLLSVWFPARFIPWRYVMSPMSECTYVLIEGEVHDPEFVRVKQEMGTVVVTNRQAQTEEKSNQSSTSSKIETVDQRSLVFRQMRYLYSTASKKFELLQADAPPRRKEQTGRHTTVARLTAGEIHARMQSGLSKDEAAENANLYGVNALLLKVPTILDLLFQEVFHPFNVFQMYSIILWIFELYYYFAGCIFVMACISIIQTLVETRQRMTELARLAKFVCDVHVLREKKWQTISSMDLVPGDLIEISTGTQPCDIAVLDGGCVVNESMLTGESVPVLKATIQWPANKLGEQTVEVGADQRSTIFSATKVLQLKPSAPGTPVVGLVVRTGFSTTQGGLILSILFPKPSTFKFITQSYFFIGGMFAISLIGLGLAIWQGKYVYGDETSEMIIHALDLITIVVPPSLPLALSVGTNFALIWLQKVKVFCISPARINLAGKVRLMCFDKTGTLTAESLEFKGVLPCTNASFGQFQGPRPTLDPLAAGSSSASAPKIVPDAVRRGSVRALVDAKGAATALVDTSTSEPLSQELKYALACCQSLALLERELIGDPLEVQTFVASNAQLQDSGELRGFSQIVTISQASEGSSASSQQDKVEFGIVDQFEFSSKLQRMSVLAENTSTKTITAYCKGSPEAIGKLSRPESLPRDYEQVLAFFARQGFRVISIAKKEMVNGVDKSLDKDKLRLEVEQDLTFLGMVLLENKVKPESEPTLKILHDAAIRTVMCTGDNPLTAATVAKECKLVEPGYRIFQSNLTASGEVTWLDTEDENLTLDPITLELPASLLANGQECKYELAVTGTVYAHLKNQPGSDEKGSFFHRVLLNSKIFARMTPDQKGDLVTHYMGMGLYSGMCGDGANDCAALKAANIGISLSESEASIAAPFTYQKPNIECVPILLSEGRSSLATSFQLFRYMCMYSSIQFSAALITYFEDTVFGNWQYLYQDLWIVFPLVIFMGGTKANASLSKKRPSGNLLSPANLFNLFMHVALVCIIQAALQKEIEGKGDYESNALALGLSDDYWGESCLDDPIALGTFAAEVTIPTGLAYAPGTTVTGDVPLLDTATGLWIAGSYAAGQLADNILSDSPFVGASVSDITTVDEETDATLTDQYGNTLPLVLTEDMQDVGYPSACYAATVQYYIAAFQYIFVAIPLALGRPWKRWWWTNPEFSGWLIVAFVSTMLLVLVDNHVGFFRLDDMPLSHDWTRSIIKMAFIYLGCVLLFDIVLSPWLVKTMKTASRSSAPTGPAYQRTKIIDGPRAKEWHALRGQFESQWSNSTNKFVDNYRTQDGRKRQ